ncbi:FIG143263: Glycosyl transferase [hydrothermal vent metagenome]|uniref:FIG143263: Glycosyl transferase n=1 Tax=hydrothermal vent metagenome TaxID=652676 RepID=A0A3B1BSL3_9ZZZZ
MEKLDWTGAEKISVVIPAYNEEKTVKEVAEKALCHARHVIVVDDCSTDATASELNNLDVTLLRNNENLGKAATLWRGIEHAIATGAEKIITMDGDGQHMPDDIPRFAKASVDYPGRVVIGMRFQNSEGIPRARYNANKFANFWVAWAAGMPLKDSQSGFRLYPAELFSRVKIKTGKGRGFVFESEILIEAGRNGFKAISVPIDAIYNSDARPSHFRPALDIAKITIMVAGKLLSRGLYPGGLYKSLTGKVE